MQHLKNSWHIIVSVDGVGKLVNNDVTTEEKHFIYCSCGHVTHYICEKNTKEIESSPKVTCELCDNQNFFECLAYEPKNIEYYEYFQPYYYEELKYTTICEKDNNGWLAKAQMLMPYIDYKNNIIRFKHITLKSITLDLNGKITNTIFDVTYLWVKSSNLEELTKTNYKLSIISEHITKKLTSYILDNPSKTIAWLQNNKQNHLKKELNPEKIALLLKYPNIQDLKLIRWKLFDEIIECLHSSKNLNDLLLNIANHKKEKSVLRAIYENYKYALMFEQTFNPTFIYLITRIINDPNLLSKLLNELHCTWRYLKDVELKDMFNFMLFLKKHYSEKSIVDMFIKHTSAKIGLCCYEDYSHSFWTDTVNMFANNTKEIEKNFKRVRTHLKSIHDEFIRCCSIHKIKKENIVFHHKADYLKLEKELKNYSFKLPLSSTQFHEWALFLHNCMFSYLSKIKQGESAIYGVFYKDTLLYAAEIRENSLVQISGARNTGVKGEHVGSIQKWLRANLIIGRVNQHNVVDKI